MFRNLFLLFAGYVALATPMTARAELHLRPGAQAIYDRCGALVNRGIEDTQGHTGQPRSAVEEGFSAILNDLSEFDAAALAKERLDEVEHPPPIESLKQLSQFLLTAREAQLQAGSSMGGASGSSAKAQGSMSGDETGAAADERHAATGSKGIDAKNCVNRQDPEDGNRASYLINSCPYVVEAVWCTEGKDCNHGLSNMHTMGASGQPNDSYPIFGTSGADRTRYVHWGACKGKNTASTDGTLEYRCLAPPP